MMKRCTEIRRLKKYVKQCTTYLPDVHAVHRGRLQFVPDVQRAALLEETYADIFSVRATPDGRSAGCP